MQPQMSRCCLYFHFRCFYHQIRNSPTESISFSSHAATPCPSVAHPTSSAMPTVGVKAEELFERLGQRYTEDEFQHLCFDFGIELDDVTSEKEQVAKMMGADKAVGLSDEVLYKIDIPANRYDLLCIEGLARSLRVFLGKDKHVDYSLAEPAVRQRLVITEETAEVRPFAVAAVLRGVTISPAAYASFIDLQEQLHRNLCRKRTLVAIGTHDLDTVQGPFSYTAEFPNEIKFKPLRSKEAREYTADELMKEYATDLQLKAYVPILAGKQRYPVIRDANGVVLSLPPIINSDHSKISTETKNIFIECTATDLTKAKTVLQMITCMFSEYCAKPFTIEPVDVVTPDGVTTSYPDLSSRTEVVEASKLNRRIGIDCWAPKLAELLNRMQLPTDVAENGRDLVVSVPPTRPDVIHECDIWEDAAIAYGFNNIVAINPEVPTLARQQPVNKLSDQLRAVVAQAGFSEALTFALCSLDDGFKNLRRPNNGKTAAVIGNPATPEFQIVRVNLLSGLLKTISENKAIALPIRVFEIADVVLLNEGNAVGASNHRRLGALYYGKTPGFDEIQGLIGYVMKMLGIPRTSAEAPGEGYYYRESADPAFFGELGAADVIYRGRRIGVFGVVHPEVLGNFGIKNPCGALEMDLGAFL